MHITPSLLLLSCPPTPAACTLSVCVCVLLCAGRDVVSLVENLRKSLPPSMGVLQRIMALEQVAAELTDR